METCAAGVVVLKWRRWLREALIKINSREKQTQHLLIQLKKVTLKDCDIFRIRR
jgi:hypothetical protein